jgi:hypothetical protein
MASNTWTNSDTGAGRVAQLFKIKYGRWQENYLNRSNPSLARIKTMSDLGGEKTQFAIDVGYIGGAGASDTIPQSNRGVYYRPELTAKTLQVAADMEHKALALAKNDAGAFVEGQKHTVAKVTQKFQWLRALAMWGPGDGSLGTIDSGGVTTVTLNLVYDLTISAATFQYRRFQKREIVNIGAGGTDRFEITAVTPSTRVVRVQRISGSTVPLQGDKVFLQNAENNMPTSLRQLFEFTTGTRYGVTFDESDWSPTRVNASSAQISVDMLNELVLTMDQKSGKTPTALYMNHQVMKSVLNSIEDRKNYFTQGEVKNRTGDFGYNAVNFLSVNGAIPMLIEPNLYDSEIVGVVEDMVIEHRVPGSPDWFKDGGGNMLLPKSGSNGYELRYISYQEIECPPIYVGQIYGLTV